MFLTRPPQQHPTCVDASILWAFSLILLQQYTNIDKKNNKNEAMMKDLCQSAAAPSPRAGVAIDTSISRIHIWTQSSGLGSQS